jgi:hypothetical protein
MQLLNSLQQRADAACEWDDCEARQDGARIAESLACGLTLLGDVLLNRVHSDVEQFYGADSVLVPVSLLKSEHETRAEIELYGIAESAAEVKNSRYVRRGGDWFLYWLAKMRFGAAAQEQPVRVRLAGYASKSPDQRRLAFSNVLVKTMPEANRAPLITFRLFPLAVWIATAMAFNDVLRAADVRNAQTAILPAIADCRDCHGRPLDNGVSCNTCGNPLWKYEWLTTAY